MSAVYYSRFPLPTGERVVRLVLLASAFLLVGHLVLGSSVLVVVAAFLVVSLGVFPIARYGILNLAGILLFLVAFRYVGFPILGKLMMGQPLDSYLEQPVGSFFAVFLGMFGYFVALTLAAKIGVGRPLLSLVTDVRKLRTVSVMAAVVGVTANLALAFRISEDYEGATVANFFVSFLHLAVIAGVAARLVRTGGKRSIDIWVIAVLASEIAFALVVNSRMALLETFLSYVVTKVAFGGRVSGRWIGGMAVLGLAFIMLITPAILYVRGVRDELSWTQRIEATVDAVRNWREPVAAHQAWRELSAESSYVRYYGTTQNVFERMSLINHVDVLKSGVDRTRQVGFEDLGHAIERVLPRVLAPDKPRGYSHGDWLFCEIGMTCRYGNYVTAPLIANGYAGFGWVGVVLYPLLLGLPVLLLLKKTAGWNMSGNIWSVYLLLRVHNGFVEGSSGAYVGMMLRGLPQDLALLLLIAVIVGASPLAVRARRNVRRFSHGI